MEIPTILNNLNEFKAFLNYHYQEASNIDDMRTARLLNMLIGDLNRDLSKLHHHVEVTQSMMNDLGSALPLNIVKDFDEWLNNKNDSETKYIKLAKSYVEEAIKNGAYKTKVYKAAMKYGSLAMVVHNRTIEQLKRRLEHLILNEDDASAEYIENFRYDLAYAGELGAIGEELESLSNNLVDGCEFSEERCGWIGGELNDIIQEGWKV